MKLSYSISSNHYNKYTPKESGSIAELLKDLATKCVSPVIEYRDKELTSVESGKNWNSKQHRSNATIVTRGNLGMIDFEGKKANLDELLSKIEAKKLFYVAIPSQSNKSDKRNARYHIMYILSEPYSINSEAYKLQAKAFFDHINYRWDNPDSGIDTRASFNGCGYFAPTIQLVTDKGKGAKKISDPYVTLDDIAKDTLRSKFDDMYEPTSPESISANEEFTSVTKRGKRIKDKHIKIIRTLAKGYVLSADTHIETSSGRFMTFDKLVESLHDVEGENPRISMLGCPICNEGHTAESTIGYAFLQYDSQDVPFIVCTGNACSDRPFFTMAEGNINVFRIDNADGSHKFVMFEDDRLVYTHDRDMTFKLSPTALADELYNMGLSVIIDGDYDVAATVSKYTKGAESVQINHDPFHKEGLNIYTRTFNISPAPRFDPTPEQPNAVTLEAIKAFEDDAVLCGYPVSLVYISYYLFHYKQIMAVLFLVNADRGSGKSFWVLELPQWYLGHAKVAGMGASAIVAGWDDEKYGKRLVCYEDIEHLSKRELGALKSNIKSDATAGDSKMLNLKGQGKRRSFGFNSVGTSNHFDQIPFDGPGDRRIYPSPYKAVSRSTWLASQLREGALSMEHNRTNIINYLFSIYKECEANGGNELHEALYYKVPHSTIREIVEDSTSTDGHTAFNIIRRSKSGREVIKGLLPIVASDIRRDDVKDLVDSMEYTEDNHIKIPGITLSALWHLLPTGKDSMRSVNQRALLRIFGIEGEIKSIRVNGNACKGVVIRRDR